MSESSSSINLPDIDHLSPAGQAAVFILALAVPGVSRTALLRQLQALKLRQQGQSLNQERLLNLLQTLHQQGWTTQPRPGEGQPVELVASLRNPVLLHAFGQPGFGGRLQALLKALPVTGHWQMPTPAQAQQICWLHLLAGEHEPLQQALHLLVRIVPLDTLQEVHPLPRLLADADGRRLLDALTPATRQLLFEHYLRLGNQLMLPGADVYRLGLLELGSAQVDDELAGQLLFQALWRADWVHFEQLSADNGLTVLRQAIEPLLAGQPQAALAQWQAWLKILRSVSNRRNVDLPPNLHALYCLTLLGTRDRKHLKTLRQALISADRLRYGGAYPLLGALVEQIQGGPAPAAQPLPETLFGLHGLMLALAAYWQDLPEAGQPHWRQRLFDARNRLETDGYLWLAAEFDALLAVQFGDARQLADVHASAALRPLVELYVRQEAWQHALTALSLLRAGGTAVGAEDKKSRLAWFIRLDRHGNTVEPREQKCGAKGQWSKGRPVALRRLVEDGEHLDFLNDLDRQAIRMTQASHGYYGYSPSHELPAELALPRLVGHPALYWHDAPNVRIDLQAGQPSLHLRADGERIHLQLEPAGIAMADPVLLHKETPTRLLVYPVSRELRQIADIVGDGLSVPAAAKAQLVEAVTAIAPLLPIHSDIPELAGHLDEIAADATLYAHLLPLDAGLRLQLLVRPLADGGWFRPGHGAERVLGEHDGRTVQAHRDLDGERQTLQQVLDACPGLALADSDGHEWQLAEPGEALQVLSELQAIDPERLQCVWPEGERMRIKGSRGLGQLRLGLKQQGDWFQLQGEIRLDDGKVLQLRHLLELLKASPGRFIKLGENDWLALGDSLRKRLDELAHLAERVNDQGLRLSALTAPLLADLAGEVEDFKADTHWQSHLDRLESLRTYRPEPPTTLQAELRDYQRDGFVWLARLAQWGVGACLADDMGLGKTVQTLALLLQRAAGGPQLVVAPTSVTLNWQAESLRFAPALRVRIYQQQRSLDDLGPGDLVIASYGLLQQDADAFAGLRWTSVVLDEAQAIKNTQTKRSRAAMALQADFRMVATGTPLENHLGELWNLFRFINPGLLGSQEAFATRFANPIENGDAAARRALRALIQPFILRRLKHQVLEELPARTEITWKVPLSDDEAHQYEALRQQAVEAIDSLAPDAGKPLQVLAEITRLRRFCCHPSLVLPGSNLAGSKLQAFSRIVEELLANRHKALVFSQFVDHLGIVRAWLDRQGIAYQYLDGATPTKERKRRVDAFQAGEGEVFLISLKAGGSGLNLTAADYVIHLDPWWNPAVEDQASDRAHRMGQQRPVTIYRLVTEHTIEEQIVALHARKRDLADSLLEGGELSGKLDADALLQLLKGGRAAFPRALPI